MSDHDHDHDAEIPRYVADMADRLSRLHCCACGGAIEATTRPLGPLPILKAGCRACGYSVGFATPGRCGKRHADAMERDIVLRLADGAKKHLADRDAAPAWFRALGVGSGDGS